MGAGLPLAYFLTFHTYGTWLHGTDRGSVNRLHNQPESPTLEPDDQLEYEEFKRLKHEPVKLNSASRGIVDQTIREVCAHRGWELLELNVRINHVHAVVSGIDPPERMMNDFKSYATRRLREAELASAHEKVWTRHGSTLYLWKPESVDTACRYVCEGQGFDLPMSPESSRDRKGAVGKTPGRRANTINPADPRSVSSGLSSATSDSSTSGPLPDGRGSDQSSGPDRLDAFVHQAVDDWRALPLRPTVRALLDHAEKLTLQPSECTENDVKSLRTHGWSDNDIHDAVQVASYFNYINRIADGLGIEFEPGHPRWGRIAAAK